MSQIVGILGASGSGRTEAARYLEKKHGFIRLKFSDGIKDMLRTLGMTEEQLNGSEKDTPIPLLGGKTTVEAARTLGTGWGRDMMDKDIWVRAMEQKLLSHMLQPGDEKLKIVVEDVVYPNEYAMLARYGAVFLTIRRSYVDVELSAWQKLLVAAKLYKLAGVHPSQVFYQRLPTEFLIRNENTLDDLYRKLELLLGEIEHRHTVPA